MNQLINHIIGQLEEIQTGKLWMGKSFEKMLLPINEKNAFIRPHPQLHSVAEILSHLTLWRTETILKIETGKGSKTDDCPENWLGNEPLKKIGWVQLKSNYDRTLAKMIDLLKTKDDQFLDQKYYDTDFKDNYPYSFVLKGMLHHDIYHLGQLGIIIKFLKKGQT